MKHIGEEETILPDSRPDSLSFREDVLRGMFGEVKKIPSKYLYDREGSLLFERICTLEEYYIPAIEMAIMRRNIEEIACYADSGGLHLVEYGCGDCVKTRLLIDHLFGLAGYVPIDISLEQLQRVVRDLEAEYPDLPVLPVCADYTREFHLPISWEDTGRKVVYFPGSTIGNFDPHDALAFLKGIAGVCGSGGGLLLGVDLKKDPMVLHRAYNDSEGVTAAFNLNLLERIRRELGWELRVEDFEHYAFYNPRRGRVEMHLVSLKEQEIFTGDGIIHFDAGESIWTESSYKYTLGEFGKLASAAGFRVRKVWTDERQWFSVYYLLNGGE
jgi:dimethylhistidine N-methyltransferase